MIAKNCIVTDRLILRRFVAGDEADVLALMGDDYICRMAGVRPFKSLREAENYIDRWRYNAFAVTERDSDRVIGIVQTPRLPWFRWYRRAEIGYCLAEEFRGRGYMTEALEAVKELLFDEWFCDELLIHVFVGNEASRSLALKCGFHPMYEAYRDSVYSPYGTVESEECFAMTRGEYEWECRGENFWTTDSIHMAA